jgi:NADH-ubiquinone oxidoreductase chain 5|tara:strand:+ start:505 stop:2517 length:2013 start_codon:yes stop_codon:yes gene_type:complete
MYLLIILLPLISALTSGLFGRYIGREGSKWITTSSIFVTFLMSCVAFYEVALAGSPCYFEVMTWIDSEMFSTSWGFLFDSLTVVMLVVVTCVSTLVHLYSTEYMGGDPHLPRFMSYLSLFTFFMLILVTADNFLQMFVGWEGVGLCSYLLINFWFARLQANKAAIKAMLVNRVGDFGLALGIFAIFLNFKSIDYATVFASAPYVIGQTTTFFNFEIDTLTLICLLLFVGAVGKSAQIGLHTWLPDAMEGPTPVSALIHAATMVTAGVFLLARCSPLFEYSPTALIVVTVMGAMTAFFAGTTGLLQNDLKRVIAYSTCSQLGYMVFACGLSGYSVGVFHLANHAFFKALLFLSAGSVIHAMGDEQDMRKMGGLVRVLPYTYAMFFIGSLALMGFPFLTGFYSKDVILEMAYAHYTLHGHFAHWLGTLAAFFTAFYSMRLLYLTFLAETNSYRQIMINAHDAPFAMGFPLFILSLGSIFVGYLTKDMIIGVGTDFWGNALFTHPTHLTMLEAEFIPHYIKLVPVIFSITGAISAFIFYMNYANKLYEFKVSRIGRNLYTFLNRKWFFDKVYNDFVTQNMLNFGYHTSYKLIDRGVFEFLGPLGLSRLVSKRGSDLAQLQTGFLYHYAFVMLLGVTFIIAIVGLWDMIIPLMDSRLIFILLITAFFSSKYLKN